MTTFYMSLIHRNSGVVVEKTEARRYTTGIVRVAYNLIKVKLKQSVH